MVLLKISKKLTEKHLYWGLFLNKVSGRGPATLLQRDSSICVFCKLCEILETLFWKRLETVTFRSNIFESLFS